MTTTNCFNNHQRVITRINNDMIIARKARITSQVIVTPMWEDTELVYPPWDCH